MKGRFAYYPGAALLGSAAEYGRSFEGVFGHLGIEVEELAGWTSMPGPGSVAGRVAAGLAAANLEIAAGTGLALLVPAAASYYMLRRAQEEEVVEVLHPLEVLSSSEGLEAVREGMVDSLKGFRVACFYGPLLTRAAGRAFDDVENPHSMEAVLTVLGADCVDWSWKTEYSGADLGLSDEELGLGLVGRLIDAAEDAGANCLAVACPWEHANLDLRQYEVSKKLRRKVEMPVFYFTELMAIAFDLPKTEKWLKRHLTTVFPLVDEMLEDEEKRLSADDADCEDYHRGAESTEEKKR